MLGHSTPEDELAVIISAVRGMVVGKRDMHWTVFYPDRMEMALDSRRRNGSVDKIVWGLLQDYYRTGLCR
jgi:hypothetical protein